MKVMTDKLISTIRNVLLKRFTSLFSISYRLESSTQDSVWGAHITVCLAPETDAIVQYSGSAFTIEEAILDLLKNVAADVRDPSNEG